MMREKCGCEIKINPITQFEVIKSCDKHNQWNHMNNLFEEIKKIFTGGKKKGKDK